MSKLVMNEKAIVLAITAVLGGVLVGITPAGVSDPAQGEGTLVQGPLSLGAGATPAFIMAVDDSGSMTFQTMFPGQDGEACWNASARSFFDASGDLRTEGDQCEYYYLVPGPRISGAYYGLPPLDSLGFARSPDYNPSYFNPFVTYEPWVDRNLAVMPDADVNSTRIHPLGADTVRLFQKYDGDKFRLRNGMLIEKGTKFTIGNQSYSYSTDVIWNGGTRDANIEYVPGVFYLKYSGPNDPLPPGYASGHRRRVASACGAGCDMWRYDPASAEARQNFANWFSYYGNRQRAMIAGMTRSMRDVSKLDVGYFTINKRNDVQMRSMDAPTEKAALYDQLLALPASGSTPNRYAVDHIGKQFMRTDSGAPIKTSCQKNSGMLFTDGYSNGGGPNVGHQDSDIGAPFQDNHASTLADVAYKYYRTTLRTGGVFAQGKVPVPAACLGPSPDKRLDCNSNLHMNFYGITLGAKGDLFGRTYGVLPDKSVDSALATEQVLSGTKPAPAWGALQDGDPSTVDEIWHATMSTRGRFINATTPAQITDAMTAVLSAVSADPSDAGSVAISGARVGGNSFSVAPSYGADGTDWYGELEAYTPTYSSATGMLESTLKWRATEKLPAFGSRNIHFGKTSGSTKPAIAAFRGTTTSLSLADLCANYPATSTCATRIASLATKTQAIDYLRGDTSNAGVGKKLRKRTKVLGDIVNSAPVVASPRDDYGYTSLLGTGSAKTKNDPYDYAAFLKSKASRATSVYVGANDGMLHAFNGEGVEEFAYIPATALGHMGNLLFPDAQDFSHRYYVDGQITVSDARYDDAWHTVLVGAAGAGGRGVFAIDVTAASPTGAPAVLWEINDRVDGETAKRIGHVLGKPLIVPVRAKNGATAWKAIFGNGYGSERGADGSAYLFVVDIGSGSVSTVLAKEASGGLQRANGLGNVVALDRKLIRDGEVSNGSDGFVDTIYSGDLHGNLWRFDLADDGSFSVGVGGKPVFTAKDAEGKRQPITAGLEAAVGPRGGVMILFGTGSFMFERTGNVNDKTNADIQSFYGILDIPGATATLARGNLQAQVLNSATNVVSETPVDYYGTKRGWYLDLDSRVRNSAGQMVASGERVVSRPRLEGGSLLFTSYSPSSTDPCAGGGSNALYVLKALTGGGDLGSFRNRAGETADKGVGKMALNTRSGAPVMDVGIYTSGRNNSLGLVEGETDDDFGKRLNRRLDEARCDVMVVVPGAPELYRWRACGRQSWRQVR